LSDTRQMKRSAWERKPSAIQVAANRGLQKTVDRQRNMGPYKSRTSVCTSPTGTFTLCARHVPIAIKNALAAVTGRTAKRDLTKRRYLNWNGSPLLTEGEEAGSPDPARPIHVLTPSRSCSLVMAGRSWVPSQRTRHINKEHFRCLQPLTQCANL
jgi:hypothetical protein